MTIIYLQNLQYANILQLEAQLHKLACIYI